MTPFIFVIYVCIYLYMYIYLYYFEKILNTYLLSYTVGINGTDQQLVS